jgi:hypothetical protein
VVASDHSLVTLYVYKSGPTTSKIRNMHAAGRQRKRGGEVEREKGKRESKRDIVEAVSQARGQCGESNEGDSGADKKRE